MQPYPVQRNSLVYVNNFTQTDRNIPYSRWYWYLNKPSLPPFGLCGLDMHIYWWRCGWIGWLKVHCILIRPYLNTRNGIAG